MPRPPSARRYAQAAFRIALERGELDAWLDDLATLARALESRQFATFLDSPEVPAGQKLNAIAQVFDNAVGPLPLNLISLLASRNRARLMPQVLAEYERLLNEHRGILLGEVTSAVSLEGQQLDAIAVGLREIVGRQVKLTAQVDPKVLGGFVARVGDKVIDGTSRTKLQELRHSLARRSA